MIGQLSSGQERLFYSFNLEDHIPANHLLRSIDRCLDLSDLRHYLADFYSPIGRPSIDPELMIRMLIVGYCYGIRSEWRLCEETHLNLAYRWFCRLSLEDEVPNHSTFSKNRHGRFRDSDLFRWLFNEVLRRCMDAGLVKGEGFAVDASIIKADASRQRGVPGDEPVNWSDPALSTRAVREYLEALDEEALAETLPKRLSLTDPQARWTAAPGGPAFYAYSTNYLIDTEHGVIMDVETEACKKIRLSEAGAFAGGLAGGIVGGKIAGITALAVCGVFSAGTAGFGAPVCGIALVGGGAFAGSIAGAEGGEQMGELIYESHYD
ncbi:transposase [Pseudomonas putida]|uniref:transposase n=1 Tax=Pseudomonas putida TaxID=303 RepID=UPI003906B76B